MILRQKTVLFSVICALFCASPVYSKPKEKEAQPLSTLLQWSLDIITRDAVRKIFHEVFKEQLEVSEAVQKKYGLPDKLKEVTESQFLEIVFQNPDIGQFIEQYLKALPRNKMEDSNMDDVHAAWRAKFKELVERKDLKEKLAAVLKDPLHPFIIGDENTPSWKNVEFYANHQTIYKGQKVPASNMKAEIINVINSATKEITFNVFDFDLKEIAQALIDRAEAGVIVRGGIDANVIEQRPEVKEVFKMLSGKKNISVYAVKSVGLNHQKLIAVDYSIPGKARTVLSSGNFTQSCIGPEGDGINLKVRPATSVPNANHMLVVDGQDLGQIVNHEISKTIDKGYQLRGREYPLSGAYQIYGPKGRGKKTPFIIIAFSPGGGLGDINRDLISQVIDRSTGPIRMVQFAASSETIENALFEKMKEDKAGKTKFDFASVGDTPFAMANWSLFMNMSGLTINDKDKENKKWEDVKDNRWAKAMGKEAYKELKNNIKVAPPVYGHHMALQPDGTNIELTSKIHHKILMTKAGDRSVFVQGSYNFSDAALGNQEYITVIVDEELYERGISIYEGLAADSKASVEQTANYRNSRKDDRDPNRNTVRDSESQQVKKKLDPKECKNKLSKLSKKAA